MLLNIRHLWPLNLVIFLHRCLLCAISFKMNVMLNVNKLAAVLGVKKYFKAKIVILNSN